MSRTRHPRGGAAARFRNHHRWWRKNVQWKPAVRAPGQLDREIESGLSEYQDHTTVWGDPDYTSMRASALMKHDAKVRVDGARYSARLRKALKALRRRLRELEAGRFDFKFLRFDSGKVYVVIPTAVDFDSMI